MMGKLHSKHADCIFVNADLNKALEDNIWKKKTGFNLANYNMDETLSEFSICLEEKPESSSPLRVDLPPPKLETETSKVLRLDHIGIRRAGRHGVKDKSKLNIEELECGVQLEGSDTAKQEWSFTLYDFDGHGRITKEDLASLLKALYDAVGSSIKLPPNGAKTLKLRLSVGQDGGAATLHHVTHGDGGGGCSGNTNITNNGKNNFNNIAISKKNNIAGGATQMAGLASRVSDRSRNTARAPKNKVREFSKLNNLTRAAAAEQKQQKQQLVKRTNEHRGQQARLASLSSAIQLAPPPSVCSGARDSGLFLPVPQTEEANSLPVERVVPEAKESAELSTEDQVQASSAHALSEHQRLADLVQENMERNRVRQQLRRLGDYRLDGHQRYHHHHHHHHPHHNYHSRQHRRRHQRATTAVASVQRSAPSVQPDAPTNEKTGVEEGGEKTSNGRGECKDFPSASTVSHWLTSNKPSNKSSRVGETQHDCDREVVTDNTGCTKACRSFCHCRRDKVEREARSSESREKKHFTFLVKDGHGSKVGESGHDSTKRPEARAEESQDRRNYYLDLAGVENTSSRFQNNYRSSHNRPGCSRRCHKGHHRSRSHDLATIPVTSGAELKFSNVITGNESDNRVHFGRASNFQATSEMNSCLCKTTNSRKCDNLLFSAVAFNLSLASEAPQHREKLGKDAGHKAEHITVGNSVVRMLATSSRGQPVECQLHQGRSKSSDPSDGPGEPGECGTRGRRKHPVHNEQQLETITNRLAPAAAGQGDLIDQPAGNTALNALNLTLNSGSSITTTTTATTTTDNNITASHPRGRRFRPLSLPGHVPACVSPHHHRRHRHRDKDHSQAMQHVAQWIEREQHAWDQDTGGRTAAAEGHIVVQRHEHHHIHEHHHHHHYHHYHET